MVSGDESQGTLLGQQMPATATTTTTTAHEGAPAHEGGSSAADASAPGGSTQAALFARLLDSVESFRKQAPAQRSRNLDSARNSLVDGAAAAQEAAAVLAAAASDDCQLGIRDHQLLDVVCPPPSIEESLSALWGAPSSPTGVLEHQIGANLLQQLSEPPPQPAPPPIWLAPLPQSVLHHICQAQYEWQLAQAQAQQHVMLQLAAQLGAPAAPPPTLLSARQAPHAAPAMEQVLGGAERLLVGVEAPYPSYCNQVITGELNALALRVLSLTRSLQLSEAPRPECRRLVCSLKEVARVARSARCLVLAPDVRRSPAAHADPVELVTRVLADAHAAGVPVVFALSRRGMGQVFGCAKSMSIVALMPVGECLPELEAMLAEAAKGRALYARRASRL